ncbi:hypothetical protein DAI22_10g081300 [Oryza sativa Japonica Group]|nr:hypothetical protein DAI22_10g081300 [Oryza sativa Japonica Group]
MNVQLLALLWLHAAAKRSRNRPIISYFHRLEISFCSRNVLSMDFVTQSHFSIRKKKRKISLPSHLASFMLRPEHHLRSPPATSPAHSTISYPPLRHRGAFRLPRAAPPQLRGAVRACAPASASSVPGATAPLEVEVAVAHREVARELASRAEARLGARLLPSAVPPDVAKFRSGGGGAGNAVGSLDVRRGAPGSTIDFMLQSSLHCKVPNGAIDITSLLIFLNASTDAPHFLMEFIQGSPTSIVVLLDLLPRKDLALHPEYIERYYENTQVDKQREKVEELPQARPY